MSLPVVSVTICMHNGARYIDEALQSVFAQTLQDFEIIVVDDGSTDGSADRIERTYRDGRLRIVRQRQQTLRVARPVAIAHGSGEFIAFLDHDDVWLPSKLERQVQAARAAPQAALVFSDCLIIDESGRDCGRLTDQFDFDALDLTGTHGHCELLQRGNFVAYPTAFARRSAVAAVGGFNHTYQYVSDYDLWLRLARRHALHYVGEPLAKYRVHQSQFTQRHSDVTLAEHTTLLRPILRSASYPAPVRIAIGDNLLGQHRVAQRLLLGQQRFIPCARAAVGMFRYPDRLRDSWRHQLTRTAGGPLLESALRIYHQLKAVALQGWDLCRQAVAHGVNGGRYVVTRARRAPRRIARAFGGHARVVTTASAVESQPRATGPRATHVWIDGSALAGAQTGYFHLVAESIRRLVDCPEPACVTHVTASAAGRAALLQRLGGPHPRLVFHRIGWRAAHWTGVHRFFFTWPAQMLLALVAVSTGTVLLLVGQAAILCDELAARYAEAVGRPRLRYSARLVRFLWRRFPAPRRRAPCPHTVEVLVWRGRFKWRDAHRIAFVQDLTTRIHPEIHTAENVEEFDEFLGYVQRHAHSIATVSEHSRRDIIDRIAVCPESVSVVPMPVHPQYVTPCFSQGFVAAHDIAAPYVLCVGAIEPRKNLRRLVRAFEAIANEDAIRAHLLVLVGPQGWDATFRAFLTGSDVAPRVRLRGFVPLEHLPSLYHFASAVVCPSVYEGFGIPVLEGMCSSGVVLASRISSLPEVLGPDGFQFDPYDTNDIARALRSALTLAAEDEAAYRRRCRRRAEAHLQRLAGEAPLPGLRPQPVTGDA